MEAMTYQSPFDQPSYGKPKVKKKKKAKAAKVAKAVRKKRPAKKAKKKAARKAKTTKPRRKAQASKATGHPHANIAEGQAWVFVYHAQFGYLISHGKIMGVRGKGGENNCWVKPGARASTVWVTLGNSERPKIATAGTYLDCQSTGNPRRSRLVAPYKSKAQFNDLAKQLAKAARRVLKEDSLRVSQDRALYDPAGMSFSAYRKAILSLKATLVYFPNGDKITEASIKRHHKAALDARSPVKPSKCPRGWYQDDTTTSVLYVHPGHRLGILDRQVQPDMLSDPTADNRFVLVYRNTSGRSRIKWQAWKSFDAMKAATAEARSLIKRKARMSTPQPEMIVVTDKQMSAVLKKARAKDWIKQHDIEYWAVKTSKNEVVALVGTKKRAGARRVRFIRSDSKLDPRYGRGPGYVPRGPWSEAKKNPRSAR
jgi:hypothetical protein